MYSDYLVIAAKTSPEEGNKGMSIFVIDRDTPGIASTKLDKLGWRASDTGEISFTDVKIPVENLMGEEGKGFPYIMQHFALERLIMGINAHARAESAIEYTLQYMSDRTAFGRSIDKFQRRIPPVGIVEHMAQSTGWGGVCQIDYIQLYVRSWGS